MYIKFSILKNYITLIIFFYSMIHDFIDLKEGINLVYGEPAAGKTTLALMLTRDYSKFSKVIYVDTENGFNVERFKQISQKNYKDCLKNIITFKVKNYKEQEDIINKLNEIKASLIIIDTIGMHYRLNLKDDFKDSNNKMINMLKTLLKLNKNNVNILLINQVYSNFNTNKIQGVGANMINKFCKVVLKLEKNPRKIIREKPVRSERLFEIKDEGIILR